MTRSRRRSIYSLAHLCLTAALCLAQAPTGGIMGTVVDESAAVIRNAKITAINQETGLTRSITTGSDGTYAITVLPPGAYEIRAEAQDFQTTSKTAAVKTGGTSTVDFELRVGILQQFVEAVESALPLNYHKQGIDGVVSRFQIENLPLNGREFLQLSVLEPGVSTDPTAGFFTRQIDVSLLGAPPGRTRITMDGGPITSPIIGSTPQNFSQEVVHEFQISTVNLDLATGLTGAGAINVVTRSGGKEYHGSGFFFFRDDNLAAYPALQRDPTNPDPFFARRQAGFYVGGPIIKNRLFFFTNLEHNNQDGVATVQPRASGLGGFGGIFPSTSDAAQVSARFDWRVNRNNNAFLRYSHDGARGFAPPTALGSLPSNWSRTKDWADQSAGSLISALRPNLINEFRFSYWYWHTRNLPPLRSDCPGDCPGLGLPQVSVLGTDFVIGNYVLVPQGGDFRRYHMVDNLTWQKGRHLMSAGFEWHYDRGDGFTAFVEPAAMVLYSPEAVRTYNSSPATPPEARIQLPDSFETVDDVLQLPLESFMAGFGDPRLPPPFGFEKARRSSIWRFYWQDTWRVRPRFTLNYGLSYAYHDSMANHDLSKPDYLAPILGADGLAPTRRDRNNFGPSLGLAWNVSRDNKTVIRAGAGIYYELPLAMERLQERSTIGPRGSGRFLVVGSLIPNPLGNVPGVPLLRPLEFRDGPTNFRGSHLLAILPDLRAFLKEHLGDPGNTDLSVRNIEVFKQGGGLIARDFTTPYAEHFNIGIQRELSPNTVLSADFVLRQFVHQNMEDIDFNRWNSVRGPVIRPCSGLEILDLEAQCSTGPIGVQVSGGRSKYKGLLVRLDKRFSGGFQFLASYALSSNVGFNGVINNDDWFESYGPLWSDRRHTLTLSGIADLPWKLRASFISTVVSRPPFAAQLLGLDLNGDGTNDDVLPGTRWNRLNRGIDERDLTGLVSNFNENFAGGRTPRNQLIPRITLPSTYAFGDSLVSQDLRLSRVFTFRERYTLTLFGEVFNLLNVANLSGYNFNLAEPGAFGQPTRRITQVFGSGGPRAFQLGGRISF